MVRGEQRREAGRMRDVSGQAVFWINGCGFGSDRNMYEWKCMGTAQ